MCEYCKDDDVMALVQEDEYITALVDADDKELVIMSKGARLPWHVEVPVRYCPMCGRKL